MATPTSDTTKTPVGPDGSTYGSPTDRPVAKDDCDRFSGFLEVADAAAALIDPADKGGTIARLDAPLRQHFGDFDYVLATAQPAVWYDARTVVDWLYASGAGAPTDGAAAQQALANVRTWHTANCTNITTH
jgi:hypothetical protein